MKNQRKYETKTPNSCELTFGQQLNRSTIFLCDLIAWFLFALKKRKRKNSPDMAGLGFF